MLTRYHLCDVQTAIGAPARIPLADHSCHARSCVQSHARCAVRRQRALAQRSALRRGELNIRLAADTDTLIRVPNLFTIASLLDELALSVRTFGAEEAQCSVLCRVSSPVYKRRRALPLLNFAEVAARKRPLAFLGTELLIGHELDHSCPYSLKAASFTKYSPLLRRLYNTSPIMAQLHLALGKF